jgi:hypothetical protein
MLASRVVLDPVSSGISHVLTGQSEKRVAITFFAPCTGQATFANESPVTAGIGICLFPGQTHVTLDVHIHGDCVQREWYVIYSGTTINPIAFIETLATCAEDQLRHFGATLAQRNRLYSPNLGHKQEYAS